MRFKKNQLEVLKLWAKGKSGSEIADKTGTNRKTVDYIIYESSRKKVNDAIKIIETAFKERILTLTQLSRLKNILKKL